MLAAGGRGAAEESAGAVVGGGRLEEDEEGGGGGVGLTCNGGKLEGVGGAGGVGMDGACSGCGCFGLDFCFFFCGGGRGVVAVELSSVVKPEGVLGRAREAEPADAAAANSAAFAMEGGGVGIDGALE